MSVFLECKKVKRTGFFPAYLGGGVFAAAIPALNMALRTEMFLEKQGAPIQILMDANWQPMAMLNVLLAAAGACLLYHIEYADGGMRKMRSLPVKESSVFFGKAVLAILAGALALVAEAGAAAFCLHHWFGDGGWSGVELCKSFGYAFLLMLPCVAASLLISEACMNMWVSLGIGVVCVFTATMLPTDSFWPSLFPFAMPFQIFTGTDMAQAMHYICAAAVELAVFSLAELVSIKVRRLFG